jgi:hypothetical protein
MDQMSKVPRNQQLWDRKKSIWRMTRIRTYAQLEKRFKELLLVLAHMTPSPPARGEEITPIRFRNGFLQERNIYLVNGRVVSRATHRPHRYIYSFFPALRAPSFLTIIPIYTHIIPTAPSGLDRWSMSRPKGQLIKGQRHSIVAPRPNLRCRRRI